MIEMGCQEKKKTKNRKREIEAHLRKELKSKSPESASNVRRLKSEMLAMEQDEINGAAIRNRNDWIVKVEKPTKYFFSLEKKKVKGNV